MKNFKKLYWILIMSLVVSVGFVSCSDDDDDDNNPNNGNNGGQTYKITAKINGESFSESVSGDLVSGLFALKAYGENFKPAIRLYFPSSVQVGQTYTIEPDSDYEAQYMDDEGFQIPASTGSLKITEYSAANKVIKGTFSFETQASMFTPEYVITEGSFSCSYSVID